MPRSRLCGGDGGRGWHWGSGVFCAGHEDTEEGQGDLSTHQSVGSRLWCPMAPVPCSEPLSAVTR